MLNPNNAALIGSIFEQPQSQPGLMSPPPQNAGASLAALDALIRDTGAAMQRRRQAANPDSTSLLASLPPAVIASLLLTAARQPNPAVQHATGAPPATPAAVKAAVAPNAESMPGATQGDNSGWSIRKA